MQQIGIEYRAGRRRLLPRAERGSHTIAEWRAILEDAGHACLACGRTDLPLQKDHVQPISRGGSNTADNLQPLCPDCNRLKGARWIDYRSPRH